ncbi:MAG: hypothetical protein JWL64_477, partial [Frankiales bacterium]|nr:hypothetical protein [Frankiales bacterium]
MAARSSRLTGIIALVAAVLMSGLTGCEAVPATVAPVSTGAAPPVPPEGLPAVAALAGLATTADRATTAGGARLPDYDREAFGPAWTDTDRNGCDTRNDVLRRDLLGVTVKPGTQGCVAASGTLLDPYTGATIDFVR